jgi:hypothetical protein
MKRELLCKDITNIILDYLSGSSQSTLSDSYGLTDKAIYNILQLRTYVECSKELITDRFGGSTNYFIKLAERKTSWMGRTK